MKLRLDELLVRKKLALSKSQAKQLIEDGKVIYNDKIIKKSGYPVDEEADVEVTAKDQYVSRGAYKLEAAIKQFKVDPKGKVVADVGASTGGFSDYLLQHGATKIYAIDVGKDQLHPLVKENPKVTNMEGVNIRNSINLPEKVDLAVVDLSYISLRLTLKNIAALLKEDGQIIALIKPQFEAGPKIVGKDGVIKDPEIVRQILKDFLEWSEKENFKVEKVIDSPITGKEGNKESLALITYQR